jgi:hypothetical protein
MNATRIVLVLACCSVLACKSDDGGGSNGTGGVMGTGGIPVTGGIGGMTGGMGGMTGGMGGMTGGMMGTMGMPTWDAVFNEVIVGTGCNGGPTCHGGTLGAGGLAMPDKATAYAALVNVAAMGMNLPPMPGVADCVTGGKIRVVPGNQAASLLVEKIELATPSCGVRMPVAGMLEPAKIQQVKDWIMAGALDN